MVTTDMSDVARTDSPTRLDLLRPLADALGAFLRRMEERRMIVELSRRSPHLIRDMGLDPEAVDSALEGSWDENPLRRQFPDI